MHSALREAVTAVCRCSDARNRVTHLVESSQRLRHHKVMNLSYRDGIRPDERDFVVQGREFLLHSLSAGTTQLVYLWPRPAYTFRCGPYSRALQAAFEQLPWLREQALWLINLGLWHLFPLNNRQSEAERIKSYQMELGSDSHSALHIQLHLCMLLNMCVCVLQELGSVLSSIDAHARGRLVWSDTTAVHSTSLRKDTNLEMRDKYADDP